MVKCVYGCGQEGVYPPGKYGKGWKCEDTHYKCPAYKKAISKNNIYRGTNNKPAGFKYNWKGRKLSESHKQSISDSMKGNQNAQHRGDRQAYYKDTRMDSNWEVGVAKYFDLHNIEWKYNINGYKLSDGKYYYPDFFIYDNGKFQKLIEVKGYFREANKKKYEMFKNEYPNIIIELWTKNILKEKNIIDSSGYLK